ncbi:MAG: hypothetical protein ACEPOZ_18015 [Marinifilaceae bacterium]
MASKKEFKKDINFLTYEIIARGFIHLEFFGDRNAKEVYNIIGEAVAFRNDYIARVNKRMNKNSAKEVKAHFRAIYDDIYKSTHDLLERIDNLDIA